MLKDWVEVGGPLQSLAFHQKALAGLSSLGPLVEKIRCCTNIHDYGCADGFGTAMLQVSFPHSIIKGFDTNEEMIARAKTIWPPFIEFECKNLDDIDEEADLIWCSHTLEHHEKPLEAIEKFCDYCKWLLVIVPTRTPHASKTLQTYEWLPLIKPEPIIEAAFNTERKHAHERTMLESSAFRLMQGRL